MKRNMLVSLLLILFVLSSCTNKTNFDILVTENTKAELTRVFEKLKVSDNGYHDLINQSMFKGDKLYFTYYAVLTLQQNDLDIPDNYILCNSIKNLQFEDIVNDKEFDNLSNVFYYVQLCNILNIKPLNQDLILKYIDKLYINSHYCLSERQKNNILNGNEDLNNSTLYLATAMATEILNILDKDYDKEQISIWVNKNYNNNTDEISDFSKLYLLTRIEKNLHNTVSDDHLKKFTELFNNSLNYFILNNTNNIDFMLLSDLIDSSYLINKTDTLIESLEAINLTKLIKILQKSNGMYGLNEIEQVHILPTYCATKYLQLVDGRLDNDTLYSTIKGTQDIDGLFIPYILYESNLPTTYYVYMTCQLLDIKINEEEIKSYLETQNETDIYNTAFFHNLKSKLDIIDHCNPYIWENDYFYNNSLDSYLVNSLVILELDSCLSTKLQVENKLKDFINDSFLQNEVTQNDFLVNCTQLYLYCQMGGDKNNNEFKNKVTLIENQLLDSFDKGERELLNLYWAIRCLKDYNINMIRNVDPNKVYSIISNCKSGALYSMSANNSPTVESIFYTYYIISYYNTN